MTVSKEQLLSLLARVNEVVTHVNTLIESLTENATTNDEQEGTVGAYIPDLFDRESEIRALVTVGAQPDVNIIDLDDDYEPLKAARHYSLGNEAEQIADWLDAEPQRKVLLQRGIVFGVEALIGDIRSGKFRER